MFMTPSDIWLQLIPAKPPAKPNISPTSIAQGLKISSFGSMFLHLLTSIKYLYFQ